MTPKSAPPQTNKALAQLPPYLGGNELFFSFFQSLLRSVDEDLLPSSTLKTLVRRWGETLAHQASLPLDLVPALERLQELFTTLGLVRLFEPADSGEGTPQILVLRCLAGRYLRQPRVRQGLSSTPCLLALLLEGAFQAVGLPFQVQEQRQGMLRSDECLLLLSPGDLG